MFELLKGNADLINALFEVFGAIFLSLNCFRLYKDKVVKGVSMLPTIFYSSWGAWNVFFYPVNGFILSGIAGVLVLLVNMVWLGMAWYYREK